MMTTLDNHDAEGNDDDDEEEDDDAKDLDIPEKSADIKSSPPRGSVL